MTNYEDILYAVKDHVAVITLNRPDKLNAWTAAMQSSVKRAMVAASQDASVRVIVVTGAGRGFCAGADMNNLQKIDAGSWDERELARADKRYRPDPRFKIIYRLPRPNRLRSNERSKKP